MRSLFKKLEFEGDSEKLENLLVREDIQSKANEVSSIIKSITFSKEETVAVCILLFKELLES